MKTKTIPVVLFFAFFSIIVLLSYILFYFPTSNRRIEAEPGPFAIGILTSDEKVVTKYQAFADYLNTHSSKKWYIEPVKNAGSFIEQIENHKLRAAFVGSAVGYRMIKNSLGVPIARGEENGISTYNGLVITRKNSGLVSLEDLRDKRFAYIDINMSSGYYYPIYLLKEKGYDPENYFRAVSFLGTTEKVIEEVTSGKFDGGALKYSSLSDGTDIDLSIQNELQIISKGGPYPDNTFMLSTNFDTKTKESIQTLLLNMKDSDEGRGILAAMGIDRFIRTNIDDFREVGKIMNY